MFDPSKYEQFAKEFAEHATSDTPERVYGLSGGQELANQASQHGAVRAMVRLLHNAVWRKGIDLGVNWAAIQAPELMAQTFDPGGIYVAVCHSAQLPPDTEAMLTIPVKGMRLFHFATFTGNELNCTFVPVVSDTEWERRVREVSRREAEQRYSEGLHEELVRYILAARTVLDGIIGTNPHPNAKELHARLARLADRMGASAPDPAGRLDAPAYGLLDLLDTSKGLNEASRLVLEIILALKQKPSVVFAQIEARLAATTS